MENLIFSVILFLGGVGLLLYFSEKLVEATAGTSLEFGISAFLISVVFIGFDPENLAVGAVASYENVQGIALGTIFGAAMVAIALALGITALIAPMKFEESPKRIILVPVASVLLIALLSLDGLLSRPDGAVLIGGYVLSVCYLVWLNRKKGLDIRSSSDEASEVVQEAGSLSRWQAPGLMVLSLAAIILGSELVVVGSETIIAKLGISESVFGMTLLALIVSFEELARELPSALKGLGEITYGNVLGSILAFFLFNTGIIALVRPLTISGEVLYFYLPVCLATVIFVTFLMMFKSIPRWAGVILLGIYMFFFGWGYVM